MSPHTQQTSTTNDPIVDALLASGPVPKTTGLSFFKSHLQASDTSDETREVWSFYTDSMAENLFGPDENEEENAGPGPMVSSFSHDSTSPFTTGIEQHTESSTTAALGNGRESVWQDPDEEGISYGKIISNYRKRQNILAAEQKTCLNLPSAIRNCGGITIFTKIVRYESSKLGIVALNTCDSGFFCLKCTPAIRAERQEQLETIFENATDDGKSVSMLTLTAPHDSYMDGKKILRAMTFAKRNLFARKAWMIMKKTFKILAPIVVIEVTIPDPDTMGFIKSNGYHIHFHLAIIRDYVEGKDIEDFIPALRDEWKRQIKIAYKKYNLEPKKGFEKMDKYGFDLGFSNTDRKSIAKYLTKNEITVSKSSKMSDEMSNKSDAKETRGKISTLQLVNKLAYAMEEDPNALQPRTRHLAKLLDELTTILKGMAFLRIPKEVEGMYGEKKNTGGNEVQDYEVLFNIGKNMERIKAIEVMKMKGIDWESELLRVCETEGAVGTLRYLDNFVSQPELRMFDNFELTYDELEELIKS